MTTIASGTDSSTVEQLTQAVRDLQQTVEQQADRIDYLERELETQSNNVTGAFAKIGEIDERVTDIENQPTNAGSVGETPCCEAGEEGCTDEQTPLETICSFPEHIAARELSANQERARFIARDIQATPRRPLLVSSSTRERLSAC